MIETFQCYTEKPHYSLIPIHSEVLITLSAKFFWKKTDAAIVRVAAKVLNLFSTEVKR